jgi:hypothetical protein
MAIATMIATPSTQSTGGSLGFREGPKSWKNPSAKEMTAAIDSRIYDKRIRTSRKAKGEGIAYQNFVL